MRLQYSNGQVIATDANTLFHDFNRDGIVDAADYTVWRAHLGEIYALPNRDPASTGPISQADYDTWVAHFGQTFPRTGAGASSSHSLAEPVAPEAARSTATIAPTLIAAPIDETSPSDDKPFAVADSTSFSPNPQSKIQNPRLSPNPQSAIPNPQLASVSPDSSRDAALLTWLASNSVSKLRGTELAAPISLSSADDSGAPTADAPIDAIDQIPGVLALNP